MVTLLGNTGNLEKSGYVFAGWTNGLFDETVYKPGDEIIFGKENIYMYAKWEHMYTVTYFGNGATAGNVPIDDNTYSEGDIVRINSNTGNLEKQNEYFAGWNTDFFGYYFKEFDTQYMPGSTLIMGTSNVTLYAQWADNPLPTIVYDANGATSGTVPVNTMLYMEGDLANVAGNSGNLSINGYSFDSWNTESDGNGTVYMPGSKVTIGTTNTILYAQWTENAFTSIWKTDNTGFSADNQIRLPLIAEGEYDFIVDWGDGSTDHITSFSQVERTHTYSTPGTYTISTTGTFKGFSFLTNSDAEKLLEISQWGRFSFGTGTSAEYAFSNCNYLLFSASDVPDLSEITSLAHAFENYRKYNIANIGLWDMSNITDMSYMFYNAYSLNIDISEWNTSAVEDMSYMFYNADEFTYDLDSWDTSNVSNMAHMFESCRNFNGTVSTWNTANVTDLSYMFAVTDEFNQNLNSWNTSNVTTMERTFYSARVFNGNISSWDTNKVSTMTFMFYNAYDFNSDLSQWDTANVTDMSYMFRFANSFTSNLSEWNTSKVTDMGYMFYYANNFNSNLSSWDISLVTNMGSMLLGSAFSTTNYDLLLNSWAGQSVQNNVTISVPCQYTPASSAARQSLIDDHNWNINDSGLMP